MCRAVIIPRRGDGNVDGFVAQMRRQKVGRPGACGLPVGGASADDKRGVPGDEAHKLERTGLRVKLGDCGAVELVVSGDELGNGIARFCHFESGYTVDSNWLTLRCKRGTVINQRAVA